MMDVGVEYYWGERENKDGQSGDARRVMVSALFGF